MKNTLCFLWIYFLSFHTFAQSCDGVPCIANPIIVQEDLIKCAENVQDSALFWNEFCPENECLDVCENTSNNYSTPYHAGSVYEWVVNGGEIVSSTPLGNSVTVLWNIGESGTLTVQETDVNGCDKQDVLCVNIKASPQPSITSLPNSNVFCKDVPIQFIAMDLNPNTLIQESCDLFNDGDDWWYFETDSTQFAYSMHYLWDFGDGTTSSLVDPIHSFTTAGVYNITLTMSNNCQCFNTISTEVEITNDPGPQIINSCIGTLCEGDTAQYCTDAVDPYWELEGGIFYSTSATDNCVNVIWNNNDNTLNDGEGMLIVSDLTTSCGSGETYYPVPILSANPEIIGKTLVCPNTYEVYSYTSVPGVEYNWTVIGGNIVGGQNNSEIKVQWNYLGNGEVILNLSSTTIDCNLGQTSIDVEILPRINISGIDEVCTDGLTAFSDLWLTNSLEFNVVNGSILNPAIAPYIADQIEVVWDQEAGGASVNAVATQEGVFCESSTTFLLDVIEQPQQAISINGDSIICAGETYLYTISETNANSPDNLQYQWIVEGGTASSTTGESIIISWDMVGPYSISVVNQLQIAPNCESNEFVKLINSASVENPVISGNSTTCLNSIANYDLTTIYPDWVDINWSLSNPNLGSVIAGQNSSQVQIEWGNQTGAVNVVVEVEVCGQIYSSSFPVNFIDQSISFSTPDDPICSEVSFSFSSTAGAGDYLWDFGDNTSSTDPMPIKSYDEPGTYLVDLIYIDALTSCTSDYSSIITIEGINGQLLPEGTNLFCGSSSINQSLYISTVSTASPIVEWFHNGTSISANNIHTVISEPPSQDGIGEYMVVLTDLNGCSNTLNTINIDTIDCSNGSGWCIGGEDCPDIMSLSYTSDCDQNLGTTTFNFDPPTGDIVEWRVDNGPITSGVSNSFTFNEAGIFNVKVREDGCVIGAEEITVPLVVDMDYSVVCDPANGNQMTYYFQDKSSYLLNSWDATYLWDFGDGTTSTQANPSHIYTISGNYDVSLSVDYGGYNCTQLISVVVSDFSTSYSYSGLECENHPSISFLSDPSPTAIADWNWTFGDGSSSNRENPQRTYNSTGTFATTLMLTDVSGCVAMANLPITIEQIPTINEISTIPPMCVNDGLVELASLINFSDLNGETLVWSGVGVEQDPLTTNYYFNPLLAGGGTHNICATITDVNGCFDTECILIDVICPEKPKIFGESAFCYDNSNHYYTTQNNYSNYQWYNNGIATTWTNSYYYFSGATTTDLTVEFTDENGCSSISEPFTVTVNPTPNTFYANVNGTLCPEQEITLSHDGNESDVDYYWNTPEKHASSTITIMSESNYNYYVVATNEFGCEIISNSISLHQAPNMSAILSGCYCDSKLVNEDNFINISGVVNNWYYNTEWLMDGVSMTPEVFSNTLQLDPSDPNYSNFVPGTFNQQVTDSYGCEYLSKDLYLETNCENCFTSIYTDTTISVCNEYLWNGETYFNSGVYEYITQTVDGCDSISVLDLTIYQPDTSEFNQTACDSYLWNGELLSESGIYSFNTQTINGCDSVSFLDLTINQSNTLESNQTSCDSYLWHGNLLTESGMYSFNTQTVHGCDSVSVLDLTIHQSDISEFSQIVCDSYLWNGELLSESGIYSIVNQTINGCDSVSILDLTVTGIPEIEITQGGMVLSVSEGEGFSYLWNTGETTQSIAPSEDGEYWVYITTMYDCVSDTVYYYYVSPLFLIDNLEIQMTLYPNPSKDVFNLTLYDVKTPVVSMQIVNMLGDLVLSKQLEKYTNIIETTIDLSFEPKGVYLLQINTDKGVLNKKIVLH